ncbi:ferredoxin [Streptomyces goshikiensis]|uniref:Ferredoxin n=1 Tax=Streptomyces goshikiensis TaxID=1942 RepID=A0ABZ1RFF2_9ACTN|nr:MULTISPECIES: NADH-quinone oxidoreductase subunit NuoF family protein [Streptomyces]WBY23095.1 ferredoxin [Streptomyces goshikiensis]WSS01920.1 ferredoxin [Streptomyces goshikiensis]WSX96793.1 ferredoxin [Streptomyces goshikiensis]
MGQPRLLAGLDTAARLDRVGHLTVHGALPQYRVDDLIDLAEAIDLRGRGGAGFPFHRKLRAVMRSARAKEGRSAVVVNASEGEPSCLKDTALLLHVPHVVLDGAQLAADALGAEDVVVGVTRDDVERSVRDAIAERGPGTRLRVSRLPERFVTGEGTSMINGIEGNPAVPNGQKVRTSERGLTGLPTLLSNTETYAQLAIAARLGAAGYNSVGLPAEPGTLMLTVSGATAVEIPSGTSLAYVLELCGSSPGQGVLVGGYHGRWLTPEDASQALLSRQSLAAFDAVLGAGAVLPLPEDTCPAGEVARVTRWMADETAGQCGPCVRGLPSLATAVEQMVAGGGRATFEAVEARMRAVRGRGACSHPDGTSGFVASALNVFADELRDHALGSGCGRRVVGALPVPADETPERLVVDWTLCRGHGLCVDLLPDVVRLDADGFPDKAVMPVPGRLRPMALRAIRRCPALALRIQE